jgi:SAM-dependent methyltransferase
VSFDRVADRYDESRGGRVRGEQHAAALEPELAAGGRTLEIGVGTGLVAAAFRQRGRDVVGIDISVEMLRRAHDRLGARVALADAERLPVRTGSVDNAYAVWVFHLVRDAAAVLREAARVLRPGGRLLVVTALDQGGDTDVDEVVSRVQLRLQPERSDHSDRLEQLGTDVGFRTGHRARVDSEPHEVTPTGYAGPSSSGCTRCTGTSTTRCGARSSSRRWPSCARSPTRTGRGSGSCATTSSASTGTVGPDGGPVSGGTPGVALGY